MGKFFPRKIAKLFIKAADYFHTAQIEPSGSHAVRLEQIRLPAHVQRRATEDTAAYIYENLGQAMLFSTREALWTFALRIPGIATRDSD